MEIDQYNTYDYPLLRNLTIRATLKYLQGHIFERSCNILYELTSRSKPKELFYKENKPIISITENGGSRPKYLVCMEN